MKAIKQRLFIAISVVMSFVVFVTPILAQQDDFTAGHIAGEQAAKANTYGVAWMAIGCAGNFLIPGIGVLGAYMYKPNPPATYLIGKSPEYVVAFTDAYKARAKSIQTNRALLGCVTAYALLAAFLAWTVYTDPDHDIW